MELTESVLERLADDEARATLIASVPPKWTMTVYPHDGEPIPVEPGRFDPARVLAVVEAHRRIVGESGQWSRRDGEAGLAALGTLRAIAAIWRDHPDYDPAWEV